MRTPVDREFEVPLRGYVRDRVVLANFRNGLRALTNPDTGLPFTETDIARATQLGTRWWVEADAIDQVGQMQARRAIYLADQARIERANTEWLRGYHGKLWGEEPLPASGSSGAASCQGTAGTLVVGSATVPDSNAYMARDAAGNRYQVFQTASVASGGSASFTLVSIDAGASTNLPAGSTLTWIRRDPNLAPTFTTTSQFYGGSDAETDADFAARMADNIRHRPAAGNDAQLRAWARASSNAVDDAFIYPCAFNAGSVLIAITQKRSGLAGPLARIPSLSTWSAAIAYLTPPASTVVPGNVFVVVTPCQAVPVSMTLRLGMPLGSSSGWLDAQPFPSLSPSSQPMWVSSAGNVSILSAPGDATLPGCAAGATLYGSDCPKMLGWSTTESKWVELPTVASIHDLGNNQFEVTFSGSGPVGSYVSPAFANHELVSTALVDHFDALGPGEVVVASDPRSTRCLRFPFASEEAPYRTGSSLITDVVEALGGAAYDADCPHISPTTTDVRLSVTTGPELLTLGYVSVFPL